MGDKMGKKDKAKQSKQKEAKKAKTAKKKQRRVRGQIFTFGVSGYERRPVSVSRLIRIQGIAFKRIQVHHLDEIGSKS